MPRSAPAWLAALLVTGGCATAPPADNPSAPRPPRSDAQQKIEARQLEQAQAKCTQEGKTAVASRVENAIVYNCATRGDTAAEAPKQ